MESICSIEIAITISQLNKILTQKIKQETQKKKIINLHPSQIKALFLLNEKGELKLSNLAKELSLTKPTVTVLVQKLEDENYISRKSCSEDKRCSQINLTDKGKKIISSFLEVENNIEKELFKEITEDEICNCLQTLRSVIDNYK